MNHQARAKAIEIWTKKNRPVGQRLGYPDCCITAFCNLPPQVLETMTPTLSDKRRLDAATVAGEYTGFIPCADCADKVLRGDIELKDLIKNRDPVLPEFPNALK